MSTFFVQPQDDGEVMTRSVNDKIDVEWRRMCSALTRDSVRISVPRAFLSVLTLFFHHVSDASERGRFWEGQVYDDP